jgi:hypothetical protein
MGSEGQGSIVSYSDGRTYMPSIYTSSRLVQWNIVSNSKRLTTSGRGRDLWNRCICSPCRHGRSCRACAGPCKRWPSPSLLSILVLVSHFARAQCHGYMYMRVVVAYGNRCAHSPWHDVVYHGSGFGSVRDDLMNTHSRTHSECVVRVWRIGRLERT